ncbi:hypothetical protein JCM8115_006903 [Rhodotorula mucilaginosa]|nr:hypothetical protein B0A53_05884 [Rhodotorula sp. CCFEE 5036]
MLFSTLTLAAALAGSATASPLLLRRQGPGTDVPATPSNNGTAVGSSYLNATVESVPIGVTPGNWSQLTNATEPYPNGRLFIGNPTGNTTNVTLAWKGQPAGGLLETKPDYAPRSSFDRQSLNLGLLQEMIELDLFYYLLANFTSEDWQAAGLTEDDRTLTQHMANQEIGHATAITNMLGVDVAPKQCVYQYPFETLKQGILFAQLVTRFGEAGTYGFLGQMDSRPSSQIILQAITTEARQQMVFRQFQGLPAMPEWFETGISQAYQWTLLSQYIRSCPTNNPRIEFTRFPLLDVTNQPYALDGTPGLNSNYTLTEGAGRRVDLYWEPLNKTVGPDGLYVTESVAGEPKFLAFIDQLNVTYAPLEGVNLTSRVAHAIVPNGTVFPPQPVVVNTAFVAVVDEDIFLTPYNISLINNHTIAVGMYQAS